MANDIAIDRLYTVNTDAEIPASRKRLGRLILWLASALFLAAFLLQALYKAGMTTFGYENWQPVLFAALIWSVALGTSLVLTRGESGKRLLFVLPAFLFTVFMVIFPTLFGLYIAMTDWNLSSFEGRQFNGLDNLWQMASDPYYWNALLNMVYYVLAVIVEYAIAFGLALLLNEDIRARKFFSSASPSCCPSCSRQSPCPG
jgi:multiple sugar transport system permease protein